MNQPTPQEREQLRGAAAVTPILELQQVSKIFENQPDVVDRLLALGGHKMPPSRVHAVNDVDLSVREGSVVGVVGESGCGKSTLARVVAQLIPATTGRVLYRGQDVATQTKEERRRTMLDVQMVFQSPFSSLNPRKRVADIIMEAPLVHGITPRRERDERLAKLLGVVGMDMSAANRFPHQFSGGQRQRIGIARALAVKPRVMICDESVAALDVSIQAQVINLLMELKAREQLTYLFISHDLGVVEHVSDEVVIMYLGRVVEQAPVEEIFNRPRHPYTQALLDAVPKVGQGRRNYQSIKGEIPSPLNPPSGCHFHPRCPFASDRCRTEAPQLKTVAPLHRAACHLND